MTASETAMPDAELRAALDGASIALDPTFRMRVLERICTRARRHAMLRRAVLWISVGVGTGFAAQSLTPPESGLPSLEIVVMTASIGAMTLMLATLTAAGADNAAHKLHRALTGKSHRRE